MKPTATHFNYFHICHRKLWLFANGINMEHTSDTVYEGKLLHESSYPRRHSFYEEISIGGSVVDFYDRKNKVIHEIKKSGKIEQAHIWQLKYYIYLFDKEGITDVTGLLEYPALRQTTQVVIEDGDFQKIETILSDIELLIHKEECPPVITSKICRSCSYFDFCYVNEKDIDEINNSTTE